MRIAESGWENLIALSSRLYKTCSILLLSARTGIRSPVKSSSMPICFCWQVPSKEAAVERMTEFKSKTDFSRIMPFIFRLFKVSRLLVSFVRRSVSFKTMPRYFSWSSGGIVPSSIASRYPLIEVSGERKS